MPRSRHYIWCRSAVSAAVAMLLSPLSAQAQTNDWIRVGSGNWDVATNWSVGLPNANQSVQIINAGSKAVAIQPSTPIYFPDSMTVQNLRVGGVAPDQNLLLLNYVGTTTPLRVLNNFNVETNGRVLMLYSDVNVSNAFNLHGILDQQGGELIFTNSPANIMQIEGGHFNLTNAVVNGVNLYLGGTNDGFVYQDSGLVSLSWLVLGSKPSSPNTGTGTYVLNSGWLMANTFEGVGNNAFGTLTQNGGTNSAATVSVANGNYSKNAGGLFAGTVSVLGVIVPIYQQPGSTMTHAGGTATITNVLNVHGQGNRHAPDGAFFNMYGGSLSTPRIQLIEAGIFTQTNGTVNVADELFLDDYGGTLASQYNLSGGFLSAARATVESSYPENSMILQTGGINVITNQLWINGTAMYRLQGGTVTASNILLTGNISYPPQLFILGAPAFTISNQAITLEGGAVVIQDSSQQLGSLTIVNDSGINLAGNTAVLRFADSHTNDWAGQLKWKTPHLTVYNWNSSTNGGGTDQLIFGASSSALTSTQIGQIHFVNPTGFGTGTFPARILPTGEVVPTSPPTLNMQQIGANLVLTWTGNFILQSATNVIGPYADVANATNPYTNSTASYPQQFFRLRD